MPEFWQFHRHFFKKTDYDCFLIPDFGLNINTMTSSYETRMLGQPVSTMKKVKI